MALQSQVALVGIFMGFVASIAHVRLKLLLLFLGREAPGFIVYSDLRYMSNCEIWELNCHTKNE